MVSSCSALLLPLCLSLLLPLQLAGTAVAGSMDAMAASAAAGHGTAAAAAAVGDATTAAAGKGGKAAGKLVPAVVVVDAPPLVPSQGTSTTTELRPGSPLLALGTSTTTSALSISTTRRALSHKPLYSSRAGEERKAWSTPLPTNASCVPSGFCPTSGLCLLMPAGLGSYSLCGTLISSHACTTQASYLACYAYCSSASPKAQGAALFQFDPLYSKCKCYKSIQSLAFSSHNAYTVGFTHGLCPCQASQIYNPTLGAACQDCGDCLARPTIGSGCFSGTDGSSYEFSGSSANYWAPPNANCQGSPDQTGVVTVPVGGNSLTCFSATYPSPAHTVDYQFLANCNALFSFHSSDFSCTGLDQAYMKSLPAYTLPTIPTC